SISRSYVSRVSTARAMLSVRSWRSERTESCARITPKIDIGTPSSSTATVTAASVAVSTRLRSSVLLGLEPEPHAAHGGDVARRVRVVAELAAQPRDVHVERLGGARGVGRPHLAHERVARDHGARL